MRSEAPLHTFGIICDANISLTMQYFPLGTFDKYFHAFDLPIIDSYFWRQRLFSW